jgi:hypothetical protein
MRGVALAALLLASALAGCGSPAPPHPSEGLDTGLMRVAGLVESDTFLPLAAANVTLLEGNLTVRTDGEGNFAFPPVAPRVYTVEARVAGFRVLQLIARPDTNAGALDFVLQRATPPMPRQDGYQFRGSIDCGFEVLVDSGSCDGGTGLLGNNTEFDFLLGLGWKTTVIDVVFDTTQDPLLDGLRLTVRGKGQSGQLGSYQQYGRFHNSTSYTARLEPGLTYTDGTAPVDSNITRFLLDVYPQGQMYHKVCVPQFPCLLGAGAGVNIQFDLYVTIFYVLPAPAGFTLRPDA